MWIVTIEAGFLPRLDVSFHFHHVFFLVALEAKFLPVFQQQLLLARLVRIVAGSALAIAGGVMFESRSLELLLEIIVALETHFGIGLE